MSNWTSIWYIGRLSLTYSEGGVVEGCKRRWLVAVIYEGKKMNGTRWSFCYCPILRACVKFTYLCIFVILFFFYYLVKVSSEVVFLHDLNI